MKKYSSLLVIVIALAVLVLWSGSNIQTRGEKYSIFSARENGASLLYETLLHMGHPVAPGHTPVDETASANDVFIIICPNDPDVDYAAAEAMLTWVRQGGRLVLLDNEFPTLLDYMALGTVHPTEMGSLFHYQLGMGEMVTGPAGDILNKALMNNSHNGELLHLILKDWNADQIWFSEYYHGYRPAEDFFTQLPLPVKLAGCQLLIITAAVVWCLGKRFGRPVPFYEETEREENEYVKALARLYIANKL